jgi:hypothetical protein
MSAQSVNKLVSQFEAARASSDAVKAMSAAWQFSQTKAALVLKFWFGLWYCVHS